MIMAPFFVPVERISRTALAYGRDRLVAPDVLRQCLPLRCPSTRANRCGKQTIDSTWNVIYLRRVAYAQPSVFKTVYHYRKWKPGEWHSIGVKGFSGVRVQSCKVSTVQRYMNRVFGPDLAAGA